MGQCSNNRMSIPVALAWLYLRLWPCFSMSSRLSSPRRSAGEGTHGGGASSLKPFWKLQWCRNSQTRHDRGEQIQRKDLWACNCTRRAGCGMGLYPWDHKSDQQGWTTWIKSLSLECRVRGECGTDMAGNGANLGVWTRHQVRYRLIPFFGWCLHGGEETWTWDYGSIGSSSRCVSEGN